MRGFGPNTVIGGDGATCLIDYHLSVCQTGQLGALMRQDDEQRSFWVGVAAGVTLMFLLNVPWMGMCLLSH